jgi:short-subunit dehydrogenase
LITGASGGLGSVLSRTLADAGMTVYGTMRDPAAFEGDRPFTMLPMEITDSASVEACVGEVVRREGRLDAVVNCVNRMMIGSVEEETVEEVRAIYETNVFGALRLCKAVLPVMRRQGRGTIVTMSSLGGLLAVPTMSAYTSSKFALEALSESLYHEAKGLGIDVVILQPVAMAMDRPATGAHLELAAGVAADSLSRAMLERMTRDTRVSTLTPERVAARIRDILLQDRKSLRVPLDKARAITWVRRLAPQRVIDRLMDGLVRSS